MEVTLRSMPAEVLLQIFEYLPDKSDVSNARLVCRPLADVGRSALGTKVTFALVPESIARLNEISSHPFFSQHISTIAFVGNVFRPFYNFDDWKRDMTSPVPYPSDLPARFWFSEEEWMESWSYYNMLLAAQGTALRSMEPSQDMEIVCKRFPKLKHLQIRYYSLAFPPPYHLRSNHAFHFLNTRHGDFRGCFTPPSYQVGVFSPKVVIPGVFMLGSLLSTTIETQLKTLWVDALGIEMFNEGGEVYSHMMRIFPNLLVLDLCIYVKFERDGFQGWRPVTQILANNRIKSLLCAASNLEEVNITYFSVFHDLEYPFYAEIAYFLPTETVWPRLRRLYLTNIEVVTFVFIEFLSAHKQTLEVLGLGDCLMVDSPSLRQNGRHCIWSDFFVPLVTTFPLGTLSLWGRFKLIKPPGRGLAENPNLFSNPPTIYTHDVVEGVEVQGQGLTIGTTIEMIVCLPEFTTFLEHEVGGDKVLAARIKEEIIRDLMDYYVLDREGQNSVVIPTRHTDYLKSFASGA
ncbi:unnamed protein product [Clonostachys solani]|uniref:F-box domain-containing protein n=1 Tax=Clonostachys solani TaxID=160281 RepID=A0A9N9VXF4_9HYPO|nr:unnamed protein product [Clonostachys solani]